MNRLRFACIALCLGTSAQAPAMELFAIGDATDRSSGASIYTEIHCEDPATAHRMVGYRDHAGELIAVKSIDFSSGRTTPSFEQHNLSKSSLVAVDYAGERLVSRLRDADGEEKVELDFDREARLVIDAGFDAFIRVNWDGLLESGGLRFQFPLATEASMVDLRIESATCSAGAAGEQCFALEPANWLFRLIAGSAELGYDPQTRRLARFSGRSNLPGPDGRGLDVDIRYRYDIEDAALCAALPKVRESAPSPA